jgi:Mitochondrial carrier protein
MPTRAESPFSPPPFFVRFGGAALGACVSETCTLPLDFAKTRVQLADPSKGGVRGTPSSGPLSFIPHVVRAVRAEGLRVMWAGWTPAISRQIVYTGGRMSLYNRVRDVLPKRKGVPGASASPAPAAGTRSSWGSSDSQYISRLLAGGITGSTMAAVAVPFEILKTRSQSAVTGAEYRQRGMVRSWRHIHRLEGPAGLFSGALPSVQRAFMLSSIELSTYDTVKGWLMQRFDLPDTWRVHVGASLVTGVAVTATVTPIDVIKTRLMAAVPDASGVKPYRGMVDCGARLLREEGFRGMYRGVIPIYARLGPGVMITFVAAEKITAWLCSVV